MSLISGDKQRRKVLPPDELPVSRHNANRFDLDRKGEGRSEYSAGDIWLLPYWMGRFLEVIRAEQINIQSDWQLFPEMPFLS